jgi:hypothetical protein
MPPNVVHPSSSTVFELRDVLHLQISVCLQLILQINQCASTYRWDILRHIKLFDRPNVLRLILLLRTSLSSTRWPRPIVKSICYTILFLGVNLRFNLRREIKIRTGLFRSGLLQGS